MKKFRIFAILGLIICAMLALATSCGKEALSTPVGYKVDESNKLTWLEVENARSYVVEITNADSGEKKETPSNKESISLAKLEEGDYEIRIKAIPGEIRGKSEYKESEWSSILYFHKDFENGCVYKLAGNGEYVVEDAGTAKGAITVPSVYRGKPVTAIADNAFRNSDIESIVISNTVKSIGEKAFWSCTELTSVTIPSSVESIGESAFQSCYSLQSVEIPGSIETINKNTFIYCRELKKVVIHEGVKVIDESAFYRCYSIAELEIANSVTKIGSRAFSEATALISLTLGTDLEMIDVEAFMGCTGLESITFATESMLKTIGDYAFQRCEKVEVVNFPQGLEAIGVNAFYNSKALHTVTIPSTVVTVGAKAFHATQLYRTAVENNDKYIYADKWLIGVHEDVQATLTDVKEVDIKEDCVGISEQTFKYFPELKTVTLPTSVKYIGEYAFYACPKLNKFVSPKGGVTHIAPYAFAYCEILSNIRLGEGLQVIDRYAFYGCKQLNNSTLENSSIIPKSVEKIGTNAFKDTMLWENPGSDGVIYAGDWVVGMSRTSLSGSTISLKEGTRGIADYAFYKDPLIRGVSGLSKVEHIGYGAFYNCTNLTSVTLNNNLKKIEDYTFYGCMLLVEVEMPRALESSGRSAFYKCGWLDSVDLSKSKVKAIGEYAFYECINLKSVDLGKYLETLGARSFASCESLREVTLPDTLEVIPTRAFYKCTALTDIQFGTGVTTIEQQAFQGTGLKEIVLPDNITTVGARAFKDCTQVEEIVFGSGIKTINEYAFYNLTSLKSLVLPASIQNVGDFAFKGATSLKSVVVSSEVKEIGKYVFHGCAELTIYTDAQAEQEGWNKSWNSARRPIVYGCTLSEDKTYVVSVELDEDSIAYYNGKVITAPQREGYHCIGWSTNPNATEATYPVEELVNCPKETVLYAVWAEGDEVEEEEESGVEEGAEGETQA